MNLSNYLRLFIGALIFITSISTSLAERKYKYEYVDRDHTYKEDLRHIAGIYAVSWPIYYLSQPAEFRDNGSFDLFEENFGKIVFDNDEPFWNWIVHPYSGSQLYLYYRANGYSRINSFKMTFISSTLFEFLVEIYTEPASAQDLYQTPILGSLGGLIFENSSMYLLNSEYRVLRILGHIINPATIFWFYEGKALIAPSYNPSNGDVSYNATWTF